MTKCQRLQDSLSASSPLPPGLEGSDRFGMAGAAWTPALNMLTLTPRTPISPGVCEAGEWHPEPHRQSPASSP